MDTKDHGLKGLFDDQFDEAPAPLTPPRAVAPAAPPKEIAAGDIVLTFVMLVGEDFHHATATIQAISEQTICRSSELIVIGPDPEAGRALLSGVNSLGHTRFIHLEEPGQEPATITAAFQAAKAPLIAFLDWYARPARDFAETVLKTDEDTKFDIMIPRLANANPNSGASWAALLPQLVALNNTGTGPVDIVPSRTAVFRKSALETFGSDLDSHVSNWRISDSVKSNGGLIYYQEDAEVALLSPSTLKGMRRERFLQGRLAATRLVTTHQLSKFTRWRRGIGHLLVPYRRYLREKLVLAGGADGLNSRNKHGLVMLQGYVAESWGSAAGYLFGEGNAQQLQHVIGRERPATLREEERRRFFPDSP